MSNHRIYVRYLLPDGEEVPLSFRKKEEVDRFNKQFPQYQLIDTSVINPNDISITMRAVFIYPKAIRTIIWN